MLTRHRHNHFRSGQCNMLNIVMIMIICQNLASQLHTQLDPFTATRACTEAGSTWTTMHSGPWRWLLRCCSSCAGKRPSIHYIECNATSCQSHSSIICARALVCTRSFIQWPRKCSFLAAVTRVGFALPRRTSVSHLLSLPE